MKLDYATDDGIGTKATLGVIVLETDETLEPELARIADLPGVALYHSRIPMVASITPETLASMERALPRSAGLLPSSREFDVIGYGCTSAATVIGPERVALAVQSMKPAAKVTEPLSAIIAACGSLGARNLGFVTPYVPEVSQKMRQKLEEAGLEIAAFGSFEEENDRIVGRISERSIVDAAYAIAQSAPCDAVVISCTNLRCLRIIPEMESKIGVPVISSNQALGWHMLRLAGLNTQLPKFGTLFTHPETPTHSPALF